MLGIHLPVLEWCVLPSGIQPQQENTLGTADLFLVNSLWSFKICISHWLSSRARIQSELRWRLHRALPLLHLTQMPSSTTISCKPSATQCTNEETVEWRTVHKAGVPGQRQTHLQHSTVSLLEGVHHNRSSYVCRSQIFRFLSQL